jgi:Iap family predicted aminopeptidase
VTAGNATHPRTAAPDAQAFDVPIDRAALRRIVEAISSVGSPVGHRATGTPEEHEVAGIVAAEMRAIGLANVAFEDVPVDAWRFTRATAAVEGGPAYEASSLAGVAGTPPGGVTGELVFVGDGRRDRLDRLDLEGRIALLDWRSHTVGASETGLELGRRGAAAIVATCQRGAAHFQGEGALGTSVGRWHADAPPIVVVRMADGADLIARCRVARPNATVVLAAENDRDAAGRNVVGVLGPDLPGAPIVVGAHHDGWFFGAFDNASGVASVLAIARALLERDWRPGRPVWFVTHTGEEYGRLDEDAQWCVGSWHQAAVAHPEWGATVPFFLEIEASGRPDLPLLVLGPPELRRFASRWCRTAGRAGMLPPRGWRFARPSTGTDQWPFQLAGVPGLSVFNWHTDFQRSDYHTTNDTAARMDFEHLENLCRLDAALLVDAERAGDRLLDFKARARDVERATRSLPEHDRLTEAAGRYARAGSRRAFARLARSGFAVDTHSEAGYLHEQAARDVAQLGTALERLSAGDRGGAARAAARVGFNGLQRWVSEDVQLQVERRYAAPRGSWPQKSSPTRTPNLWRELAALRGERGARPFGPWVERSLERHLRRMEAEVARRSDRLASALSPPGREHPDRPPRGAR